MKTLIEFLVVTVIDVTGGRVEPFAEFVDVDLVIFRCHRQFVVESHGHIEALRMFH